MASAFQGWRESSHRYRQQPAADLLQHRQLPWLAPQQEQPQYRQYGRSCDAAVFRRHMWGGRIFGNKKYTAQQLEHLEAVRDLKYQQIRQAVRTCAAAWGSSSSGRTMQQRRAFNEHTMTVPEKLDDPLAAIEACRMLTVLRIAWHRQQQQGHRSKDDSFFYLDEFVGAFEHSVEAQLHYADFGCCSEEHFVEVFMGDLVSLSPRNTQMGRRVALVMVPGQTGICSEIG